MVEFIEFAQQLSGLGFGTLLVLILYGSYKGMWVWGTQLQKIEADRDQWKEMALELAGVAEKSVSIAKTRVP